MKTPWQYAETGNEYSHQVALFQWANMAGRFGPLTAADPLSYTVKGHVRGYGTNSNMPIPELLRLYAIKNAGHGDAVRGAKSAAEGVKPGVPDLFLPVPINRGWPFAGLYIELKRPASANRKKGVKSDLQNDWQEYLQSACYCVQVCFGWEAARDCLLAYLGR